VVEVLDGKAVAQGMRAYLFGESGPLAGGADDVLYAAYGDAARCRFTGGAGEEVVGWFLVAEVGYEVATDGLVVGECPLFVALGFADDEGSVVAVEVVQSDATDFSGAQAESEDEAEDETVFGCLCYRKELT